MPAASESPSTRLRADGASDTAVVRKMRSPQTIGLEWPRPGMGALHTTLVDDPTFQAIGGLASLATPEADGPRNDGHCCAPATAATVTNAGTISSKVRDMVFGRASRVEGWATR